MWAQLRKRRLQGLKWERQEPIGRYIVDFYCSGARVVVEVEGGVHALRSKYDQERQEWLKSEGIRVLRFPVCAVMNDLDRVLSEIEAACWGSIPASTLRRHRPEVPHPRFASLTDPSHGE